MFSANKGSDLWKIFIPSANVAIEVTIAYKNQSISGIVCRTTMEFIDSNMLPIGLSNKNIFHLPNIEASKKTGVKNIPNIRITSTIYLISL